MDPDEARLRVVELANAVLAIATSDDTVDLSASVAQLETKSTELAEAVHDLDEWLRKGGFLPQAWVKGRENDARLVEL